MALKGADFTGLRRPCNLGSRSPVSYSHRVTEMLGITTGGNSRVTRVSSLRRLSRDWRHSSPSSDVALPPKSSHFHHRAGGLDDVFASGATSTTLA